MNGRRYALLILAELYFWARLVSMLVGAPTGIWPRWLLISAEVSAILGLHWCRRRARRLDEARQGG